MNTQDRPLSTQPQRRRATLITQHVPIADLDSVRLALAEVRELDAKLPREP